MNERELQRRLAKHLKMPVLDDGIWTVLTTRHPEDVKRAQTGDESDLGFVLTLGEHYLFAKEVFTGAPSPPGGTQKLRHVARAVTPEDELRSEAIWAAQVEAAFNDERVSGFRRRVLGKRVLTMNEAVDFLRSPATACFSLDEFRKHGVSPYAHASEIEQGELTAPGTKIIVAVEPGNMRWARVLADAPDMLDVTILPRPVTPAAVFYPSETKWAGGHKDADWEERVTRSVYRLVAWPGSVLAESMQLAAWISESHSLGDPAYCLWFLLTGDPPLTPHRPIYAETTVSRATRKALWVRLDIRPWLSSDTVLSVFRLAQQNIMGSRNRPVHMRDMQLVRFVACKSFPGPRPTWRAMREEWNSRLAVWKEEYPDWNVDDKWRWRTPEQMNKQHTHARKSVLAEP